MTGLISYAVPCHERQADLAVALPYIVAAAQASPPVQVVLVDYANTRPLPAWPDGGGYRLLVVPYRGRQHYHMAHARNLAIREATGVVVVTGATDLLLGPSFFQGVRTALGQGATWLRPEGSAYPGVVACQRDELVAAGGYDERFEFYGGEDKDLTARLLRRGRPWAPYPVHELLLGMLRTRNANKVAHYRLPLTKTEMLERGSAVLAANNAAGALVANAGQDWGAAC